MADEERPSKIRKLSHDGNSGESKDLQPATTTTNDSGPSNGLESTKKETSEDEVPRNETLVQSEEKIVDESINAAQENGASTHHAETQLSQDQPLSKNQLKKLRKKAEWEAKRPERKAVRKEKLVAKRERKRAAIEQEIAENGGEPKPKPKPVQPPKAQQLPVTFLFDCDFDDLMRDNERVSLSGQITRSYSDNKNALFRAHLTICSFGGKLRERFEKVLVHHSGWRGVRWLDEDFVEASEKAKEWMADEDKGGVLAGSFAKYATEDAEAQAQLKNEGEIVYLSAEADETLTELKPYSTYIIGGLVDKNREKGICHKRATKRGVRTAKLPIGDYLEMNSRKVLTTNHVNEIMIKWLECGDWGEAFMKVIPKRKGGKLRGDDNDSEEEADDAKPEDRIADKEQAASSEVKPDDSAAVAE